MSVFLKKKKGVCFGSSKVSVFAEKEGFFYAKVSKKGVVFAPGEH